MWKWKIKTLQCEDLWLLIFLAASYSSMLYNSEYKHWGQTIITWLVTTMCWKSKALMRFLDYLFITYFYMKLCVFLQHMFLWPHIWFMSSAQNLRNWPQSHRDCWGLCSIIWLQHQGNTVKILCYSDIVWVWNYDD